jgi:hypothetical protein
MVEARASLHQSGQSVSAVVLVDDYNPESRSLIISEYEAVLDARGAAPDWVASEARLVPAASAFLESLPPRVRRSEERRANSTGRLSCSLLVASWYLVRLGALNAPASVDVAVCRIPGAPLVASRLVNLLHAKYEGAEARAERLLSASALKDQMGRIETVYHDDDGALVGRAALDAVA